MTRIHAWRAIPDGTRVAGRPSRTRPRTARTSAAAIATAGLSVLAVACGGGPGATGAGGSPKATAAPGSASAVAYTRCMRSHGVPKYPDPGSGGEIPKETADQLGVSTAQLQAAARSCGHLAPGGGGNGRSPAEVRLWWSGMLQFARCMRSHGVRNWPDPTPYPPHPDEPTFELPAGIRPTSQVISKMHECQRLVPRNYVAGHIDNDSWQAASRALAGS